jgi:hypothetical protein
MMDTFDFVSHYQNLDVNDFKSTYDSSLTDTIDEEFSDEEKVFFMSNMMCFTHHKDKNNCFIDVDKIWRWLGFSNKSCITRLIKKTLTIGNDYIILDNNNSKKGQLGGQNIQKFYLNNQGFQLICLRSSTERSHFIHSCYIKLMSIMFDTIDRDKKKIEEMMENKCSATKQIEISILEQFPVNTQCIYIGSIDDTSTDNETLLKFGQTNNLKRRVTCHRKTYKNFVLKHAFRVSNSIEVENLIKTDARISPKLRTVNIDGTNKVELICHDDNFTFDNVKSIFCDIIQNRTFSEQNFKLMLDKNNKLTDKVKNLNKEIFFLKQELIKTKNKEDEAAKAYNDLNHKFKSLKVNEANPILDEENSTQFDDFIHSQCIIEDDSITPFINIEGRFRIWSQSKLNSKKSSQLKNYFKSKFDMMKDHKYLSFKGLSLKNLHIELNPEESDVDHFVSHTCTFRDTGRLLMKDLVEKYREWNKMFGKDIDNKDIKSLKKFLDNSIATFKSTVWVSNGSNEGYYGIEIDNDPNKPTYESGVAKYVYKKRIDNNEIIEYWTSVAQAAFSQRMSISKMSRIAKSETTFGDYYYTTRDQPSN